MRRCGLGPTIDGMVDLDSIAARRHRHAVDTWQKVLTDGSRITGPGAQAVPLPALRAAMQACATTRSVASAGLAAERRRVQPVPEEPDPVQLVL